MNQTGGDVLARQLVLEGVTEVFGVPGVQLDHATEGLRKLGNDIRFLVTRHEQATSYMADGYARTTGRLGVCMVVPGPGLLNAMAGLSTAYACNSPVLCIAGDIHSGAVGQGRGLLHEVRDQSTILGTVTKWHGRAEDPALIPALVRRAVREIRSGRPQPVGIEISHDVLAATAEIEPITPAEEDGRMAPAPEDVARAAEMLDGARRPVIYAGGGVLAAEGCRELAALAERLQAPVVMSEEGRGALSDRHPLALTTLEGRAVFPHADVVLAAGSRFLDTTVGNPAWPADRARYIYLNLDPSSWAPPRRAEVAIEADCRLGLAALAQAVAKRPPHGLDLAAVRRWAREQADAVEPQASWTRALRAAIPDDGILVNELTQVGYFARVGYPVYEPNTLIGPGYQGTLGYGFPTALGAKAGNPGRVVVSINGDGGFGWNLQELATARKYDLGVAIVVFNDGHFGNVRTLQQGQFGEAYGVELRNPHYDRLAAAFDLPYARCDAPGELEGALRRGLSEGGPFLVEARVGAMPSPWHLLRLVPPGFAASGSAPPNPLGEPRS